MVVICAVGNRKIKSGWILYSLLGGLSGSPPYNEYFPAYYRGDGSTRC